MFSALISLDHKLFVLIHNTLGRRALDPVFEDLSSMGGWTVALVTLVLLATEGRRWFWRHVSVLLVFLVVVSTVVRYMKETFDRSRPTAVFAEKSLDSGDAVLRVATEGAPRKRSFPSGHSMTAFFMLVYAGQRRRRFRPWLLLLASGIAFGRIYVGVHFPWDCLAGSLIGAAGALLASATFQRLEGMLWTTDRQSNSLPSKPPVTGVTDNTLFG